MAVAPERRPGRTLHLGMDPVVREGCLSAHFCPDPLAIITPFGHVSGIPTVVCESVKRISGGLREG